jgi:uncharacterized protein (TIGR03000 family)
MTRRVLLLATLFCTLPAGPVFGQGLRQMRPPTPPVPVPGINQFYPPASPFAPPLVIGQYGLGRFTGLGYVSGWPAPVLYGYGGYVYGPSPYYTGLGPLAMRYPYLNNQYGTSVLPDPSVPLPTPVRADPQPATPLPAELTIEFPVAVRATANGTPSDREGPVQTFTSPPLRPGETHTFHVRARWTEGGQEYEWERAVTLDAGQQSGILVTAGYKVEKK